MRIEDIIYLLKETIPEGVDLSKVSEAFIYHMICYAKLSGIDKEELKNNISSGVDVYWKLIEEPSKEMKETYIEEQKLYE